MALNRKGQASVTDAMYFLIIISGLATLMFFYTANYGSLVTTQTVKQYNTEFATSALKTILYSSTARDNLSLNESEEIDYLLAVLKEDYAIIEKNGSRLKDSTKTSLKNNIETVMSPFQRNFDYLYYIYSLKKSEEDERLLEEFVIIFLYSGLSVEDEDSPGGRNILRIGSFCTSNESLDSIRVNFVRHVGEVSRAPELSVFLPDYTDPKNPRNVRALSSLLMWPSTDIKEALQASNLNCPELQNLTLN